MAGDGTKQGRAIFISYRRDDSEGESGRLFDDLVRAFGDDSVFMDVSGIEPGVDFREAIDKNVACCGVLLAVIGPTWASVTNSAGERRLDNPEDYVRLEIASALARKIPVIPVLVHEAHMPPLELLPDNLKDLRYRNSVELTHARWNSDVALFIGALKNYVTVSKQQETETVHATLPVQLPAPQPAGGTKPVKKSKLPLFLGIGAAAVVLILVVITMSSGSSDSSKSSPDPEPSAQTQPQGSAQPDSVQTKSVSTEPQPAPDQDDSAQPQSISPEDISAVMGRWRNSVEPQGVDGLNEILVVDRGGQLMVQAWGKCADQPCDWGSRKVNLQGGVWETKSFDLRNTPQEVSDERSAKIQFAPSSEGLQVTVKNTLHSQDGATRVKLNPLQFQKVQ